MNSEGKYNENKGIRHFKLHKNKCFNTGLNLEIKLSPNKENQSQIFQNKNQSRIKNILFLKSNNKSFNLNLDYLKRNTSESTKNNYTILKDNNSHFLPGNISFLSIKNTSISAKHNNNINQLKNKNNKKFFCVPRKQLSNFISPRRLLIKSKDTEKITVHKSSKLSSNFLNNKIIKIQSPKKKQIPKIINPNEFKIIKQIGKGSFGEIYKVKWNQNNEKYAMKIMFTKSKDNILYIQDKVHLIMDFEAKTKCNGLINIYGESFNKIKDNYYYYEIMELAERDWEQEINIREKNLNYYSEFELFTIMSQLVKTLSLLQKNHITHRDIKMQNILLIKNKFKICDFGEARKLAQKGVIVQPSRGSELFMSPIQFFGLNQKLGQVQHNTYKSDVFSLGMCILYASTLNQDCLYDIRELTDMNIIKNILKSYLCKRYSMGFIKLLLCFLEVHEKKRPDFIQLENMLSQIKIIN